MSPTGIEAVFLANREKLVRFLAVRGAGDAAEDLVQDLWVKLAGRMDGPIANPLAYLYRAADMLMVDRYRSRRQAERREQDWVEEQGGPEPPAAERALVARQTAERIATTLAALGERPATIFRRVRIEGVPQKRIAEEWGISISTVESDLRLAAQAIAALKDQIG
ncbi:RNA polymerase sigma factor [Sphingomonas sp. CFBP8993]|uniref:RNA polymerase sigma factor n=1 Tax=Sphingomonas sp. CFBP8993 TaxID=3096526 RepID=UPI002A6A91EA|nr:RNA polymerase sigma factor [Sphingomonas sp. CFBP8993]MDY0957551.1 RNA polymerase sigma factor [Sphingomonas sp. CFBP8993]